MTRIDSRVAAATLLVLVLGGCGGRLAEAKQDPDPSARGARGIPGGTPRPTGRAWRSSRTKPFVPQNRDFPVNSPDTPVPGFTIKNNCTPSPLTPQP